MSQLHSIWLQKYSPYFNNFICAARAKKTSKNIFRTTGAKFDAIPLSIQTWCNNHRKQPTQERDVMKNNIKKIKSSRLLPHRFSNQTDETVKDKRNGVLVLSDRSAVRTDLRWMTCAMVFGNCNNLVTGTDQYVYLYVFHVVYSNLAISRTIL